jgi:hypothetical protein
MKGHYIWNRYPFELHFTFCFQFHMTFCEVLNNTLKSILEEMINSSCLIKVFNKSFRCNHGKEQRMIRKMCHLSVELLFLNIIVVNIWYLLGLFVKNIYHRPNFYLTLQLLSKLHTICNHQQSFVSTLPILVRVSWSDQFTDTVNIVLGLMMFQRHLKWNHELKIIHNITRIVWIAVSRWNCWFIQNFQLYLAFQ